MLWRGLQQGAANGHVAVTFGSGASARLPRAGPGNSVRLSVRARGPEATRTDSVLMPVMADGSVLGPGHPPSLGEYCWDPIKGRSAQSYRVRKSRRICRLVWEVRLP